MKTKLSTIDSLLLEAYQICSDVISENKVQVNDYCVQWKTPANECCNLAAQKIGPNAQVLSDGLKISLSLTNEHGHQFTSSFIFEHVPELLKNFKQQLSYTKDKTYVVGSNWQTKLVSINQRTGVSTSLPKHYYEEIKDIKDFAQMQFDCIEEIEKDAQRLDAISNLENAKKAGYKKLEAIFKKEVEFWDKVLEEGKDTDYSRLVKYKQELALKRKAEGNPAIQALIENEGETEMSHYRYDNSVSILETFTRFKIEPVNDPKLYFQLRTAEKINQIENGEKTTEAYINTLKTCLKNGTENYQNEYFKKNGTQKSMSHRQRSRMYGHKSNLDRDSQFLDTVIKNRAQIQKFVDQLKNEPQSN